MVINKTREVISETKVNNKAKESKEPMFLGENKQDQQALSQTDQPKERG